MSATNEFRGKHTQAKSYPTKSTKVRVNNFKFVCANLPLFLRVFGKGVSEKEFEVVRALCSQVRSFLPLQQTRNTPRNFETKRLFRNAFSERLESVRKRSVTK